MVDAIVRLPHPRIGDSQGQETFLAPSADKYMCIYMYIYTYIFYIYFFFSPAEWSINFCLINFLQKTLDKKCFPLRIFSRNMSKSTGNCVF